MAASGHYNLRLVYKTFYRVYGDLFNHLVSTKVMFYGKVYGHGNPFAPDNLVSNVTTDIPNHPVLIGEFADAEGKRYVMIVNNSQTVDAMITVAFPGKDARIISWDWNHNERPDAAFSVSGYARNDDGFIAQHWLAPGQEAVYRVESSLANSEPNKFE